MCYYHPLPSILLKSLALQGEYGHKGTLQCVLIHKTYSCGESLCHPWAIDFHKSNFTGLSVGILNDAIRWSIYTASHVWLYGIPYLKIQWKKYVISWWIRGKFFWLLLWFGVNDRFPYNKFHRAIGGNHLRRVITCDLFGFSPLTSWNLISHFRMDTD